LDFFRSPLNLIARFSILTGLFPSSSSIPHRRLRPRHVPDIFLCQLH
jgi:hypothetical protein